MEITDLNRVYMQQGRARLVDLGEEFTWFDAGTYDSMLDAAMYVQRHWTRTGHRIGSPEEVALTMGYIDAQQCHSIGAANENSDYGRYGVNAAAGHASMAETDGHRGSGAAPTAPPAA